MTVEEEEISKTRVNCVNLSKIFQNNEKARILKEMIIKSVGKINKVSSMVQDILRLYLANKYDQLLSNRDEKIKINLEKKEKKMQ